MVCGKKKAKNGRQKTDLSLNKGQPCAFEAVRGCTPGHGAATAGEGVVHGGLRHFRCAGRDSRELGAPSRARARAVATAHAPTYASPLARRRQHSRTPVATALGPRDLNILAFTGTPRTYTLRMSIQALPFAFRNQSRIDLFALRSRCR